LLITKPAPSR